MPGLTLDHDFLLQKNHLNQSLQKQKSLCDTLLDPLECICKYNEALLQMHLLTFLGEVFALIGAVEKFSIEKLDSDHGKNELKS